MRLRADRCAGRCGRARLLADRGGWRRDLPLLPDRVGSPRRAVAGRGRANGGRSPATPRAALTWYIATSEAATVRTEHPAHRGHRRRHRQRRGRRRDAAAGAGHRWCGWSAEVGRGAAASRHASRPWCRTGLARRRARRPARRVLVARRPGAGARHRGNLVPAARLRCGGVLAPRRRRRCGSSTRSSCSSSAACCCRSRCCPTWLHDVAHGPAVHGHGLRAGAAGRRARRAGAAAGRSSAGSVVLAARPRWRSRAGERRLQVVGG